MDKTPKLELKTNVPVTVKLVKFIKRGDGEYGPWFMWIVEDEGTEKIFFPPNESLHEQLTNIKSGSTITILKKEETNAATGKKFTSVGISSAPLFDEKGTETPPPQPGVVEGDVIAEGFRSHRKNMMFQNLLDAYKIAKEFNNNLPDEIDFTRFALNREDVRAMAISFEIALQRKNGV